jgi:hypothetical protein
VAALSGVVFSILLIISLVLVRFSIPSIQTATGGLLTYPSRSHSIETALELVPFAGVAFLWFLGVLRNHLAQFENPLISTVLYGSGLLFIACLFGATAVGSGMLHAVSTGQIHLPSDIFFTSLRVSEAFMNVLGIKMAGVFMFTLCSLGLRTRIFSRRTSYMGFTCGAILVLAITSSAWIALLFPLWTLILSAELLFTSPHLKAEEKITLIRPAVDKAS